MCPPFAKKGKHMPKKTARKKSTSKKAPAKSAQRKTIKATVRKISGAGSRGLIEATPVGEAKSQCWQKTLKYAKQNDVSKISYSATINPKDCVELTSAAVNEDSTDFVFCCKKTDDGKCKDCTAIISIVIVDAANKQLAAEKFRIDCIST